MSAQVAVPDPDPAAAERVLVKDEMNVPPPELVIAHGLIMKDTLCL